VDDGVNVTEKKLEQNVSDQERLDKSSSNQGEKKSWAAEDHDVDDEDDLKQENSSLIKLNKEFLEDIN